MFQILSPQSSRKSFSGDWEAAMRSALDYIRNKGHSNIMIKWDQLRWEEIDPPGNSQSYDLLINGWPFTALGFETEAFFKTTGWYGWQNWSFSGTWERVDTYTVKFSNSPKYEAEVAQMRKDLEELKLKNALDVDEIRRKHQEETERQEEEHKKEQKRLEKLVSSLNNQMEQVTQQLEKTGDPDHFEQSQKEIYSKFLHNVESLQPSPKTKRKSFAVLGWNGVGKSSLINSLVGKEVTEVDEVDCTTEIKKVFKTPTQEFWDVPGQNDIRSYANLKMILKIQQMHCILIVYQDRVEHILNLARLVKSCVSQETEGTKVVIVRNKCDKSTPQKLETITGTEKRRLVENATDFPLRLVSAQNGTGVGELKRFISFD